jgi:hypothetical protein
MKLTVLTIKVFFWVSLALLIVTGVISFWLMFNDSRMAEWIAAVLIGVFGSSTVVMLCEYVRYIHQKRENEDLFYYNLSLIYIKLLFILSDIKRVTNNPHQYLNNSFLQPQISDIHTSLGVLSQMDYCQIRNNRFGKFVEDFRRNKIPQLTNFSFVLRTLDISIREDLMKVYEFKLDQMKKQRDVSGIIELVTSESPHTKESLRSIKEGIDNTFLDMIDCALSEMEINNTRRYRWKEMKEQIRKDVR